MRDAWEPPSTASQGTKVQMEDLFCFSMLSFFILVSIEMKANVKCRHFHAKKKNKWYVRFYASRGKNLHQHNLCDHYMF